MNEDVKNLTVGSIIEVTAHESFKDDSPMTHYVGYYYGPISESKPNRCFLLFSDPLDPNPARASSSIIFDPKDIVNVFKIREVDESNKKIAGALMMINGAEEFDDGDDEE